MNKVVVAYSGDEVVGVVRCEAEKRPGRPVITSKKAVDFVRFLTDAIECQVEQEDKEDKAE